MSELNNRHKGDKKQFNMMKMKNSGDNHYTPKDRIFDLPFKILVIGRSQLSGKTTICANILLRDEWYNSDFKGENIYIVSPSTEVDVKMQTIVDEKDIPSSNIITSYDEEVLMALYDMIEQKFLEQKEAGGPIDNWLVFFDDMSFGGALKKKQHGAIAKLFCNGRHLNISTIITAQKYSDVATVCRENNTGCILFASTDKQLDLISDDHNYLESKKDFRKMFKEATREKHSFIVVNYSNDVNERYLDSDFEPITHYKMA